ncbi:MAG: glycosyltransferase, partial [Thermoplasmata archaeon]|nr:glycosyltransferase [Thermoplasmata archaeon]
MGSDPTGPAFVSVVVTVKNESRHLRHLFESLRGQEAPFEVVLVDALSRDGTFEIAKEYERNFPGMFRAFQRYGSRGIGRNVGVHEARGEFVAFIDGDCFADSRWLHQLRGGFQSVDVVAGKTVNVGQGKYAELERVELFERGSDVTFPSCNLGYRKALFDRL